MTCGDEFNGVALRRHAWVWLRAATAAAPDPVTLCAPAADCAAMVNTPAADCAAMINTWRAASRPFVVARRRADDPPGWLRLGLATPDKRRIGLTAPVTALIAAAPPPLLRAALAAASSDPPGHWPEHWPEQWRGALAELVASWTDAGLGPRIYGSLAWELRCGLPYVRPGSDLDVLFAPTSWAATERLLALLTRGPAMPWLDGEIIFPDGWAAAWRELAARPDMVLLKGPETAELRRFDTLRHLFAA